MTEPLLRLITNFSLLADLVAEPAVGLDGAVDDGQDERGEDSPPELPPVEVAVTERDDEQPGDGTETDDEVDHAQHEARPLLRRGVGDPPQDVEEDAEDEREQQTDPEGRSPLAEVEGDHHSEADTDDSDGPHDECEAAVDQLELGRGGRGGRGRGGGGHSLSPFLPLGLCAHWRG